MRWLIMTLLLWAGVGWSATSFNHGTHKAVLCITADDWADQDYINVVDTCSANFRMTFNQITRNPASMPSDWAQRLYDAYDLGCEIGAHGPLKDAAGFAAYWPDQADSIVWYFSNTKNDLDSLMALHTTGYSCKTWVYPGNVSNVHTDSIAALYYDVVRGNKTNNDGISYHDTEDPTLVGSYQYCLPMITPASYCTKCATADDDDTTGMWATTTAVFDRAVLHHELMLVNIHAPDQDMGVDQLSYLARIAAARGDIWVTTMDTMVAEFGDYLRDTYDGERIIYFGPSGSTDNMGTEEHPLFFDETMLEDSYAYRKYSDHVFKLLAGTHTICTGIGSGYLNVSIQPLTIRGAGETTTTMDLSEFTGTYGWKWQPSTKRQHVRWEDLTITGPVALISQQNDFQEFERVTFHPTSSYAILCPSSAMDTLILNDCTIHADGTIAIDLRAAAVPDSFRVSNCVFDVESGATGVRLQANMGKTYIYNDLYVGNATSSIFIDIEDSTGSKVGLYISNNAIHGSTWDASEYQVDCCGGALSNTQFVAEVSAWRAGLGLGCVDIATIPADPYNGLIDSDTLKWGGCQLYSVPVRPFGHSWIGRASYTQRPRVPGHYSTLIAANRLVWGLGWVWAVDDTIDFTVRNAATLAEYGTYRSTHDSLYVQTRLATGTHRSGGWK